MNRFRPKPTKDSDADAGVSDVVGSVLLVAITVGVFVLLAGFVWLGLKPVATVHADVVASLQGGQVVLLHQGGQTLSASTSTLSLTVGSLTCKFTGTSGPNALFTASQFGGVDHQNLFRVGDRLNVTPVAPCPAIGTQSVSVYLLVQTGTGSQLITTSLISPPSTLCSNDIQPPTVGSWTQAPSDVTNATTGMVTVTVGVTDDCSGADSSVAPHFWYRIAADPLSATPAYADTGTMFRVGFNVWQGNVTDPGWAAKRGSTLQYYVTGMSDLASPPNVGSSSTQADPIQGTIVVYAYPTTCTMAIGTVTTSIGGVTQSPSSSPNCPLAVSPNCSTNCGTPAVPPVCPFFNPVVAGANVLYPGDCNEEGIFLEAQAVAPTNLYAPSAKEIAGTFLGTSCGPSDTSSKATQSPDNQYACYVAKTDKLRTYGFTVGTGTITKVELRFVGHISIDAGGTTGTGSSGASADNVKVLYNTGSAGGGATGTAGTISAVYSFSGGTCVVTGGASTLCTGTIVAHECTPSATIACSGTDQDFSLDITSARSWAWTDFAGVFAEADAVTSNNLNHLQVDGLWIRVTGSAGTTNMYAASVNKNTGTFTGTTCPASDSGQAAVGQSDAVYACYQVKTDKLDTYGFSAPTGGAITKVELRFLGHLSLDPGATPGTLSAGATADNVKIAFNTGSTNGAGGTVGSISAVYSFSGGTCVVTGGLPSLCAGTIIARECAPTSTLGCSGTDQDIALDVTSARSWSWSDFSGVFVEADAQTSANANHLQVDALWLRVTAVNSQVTVSNIYATSVVSADTSVNTPYHAELQPDNLYAVYTTKTTKETVGGFPPLSGTISKVEIAYEGHCVGTVSKPCGSTDKVAVSYKVGGFKGATVTYVQSTVDTAVFADVTSARAWTWNDLNSLTIQAQASTHDQAVQTWVDSMWVRVTASGVGYTLDAQMGGFSPIGTPPASPVQNVLEIRYEALANDTFYVQVCQDNLATCGTWATRGTPLASAGFFIWTWQLTSAEYNAGSPRVRLLDNNPLGSGVGKLGIDYMRVGSS
jgi:hypothetical protein